MFFLIIMAEELCVKIFEETQKLDLANTFISGTTYEYKIVYLFLK